jgi:hypothetical protein
MARKLVTNVVRRAFHQENFQTISSSLSNDLKPKIARNLVGFLVDASFDS